MARVVQGKPLYQQVVEHIKDRIAQGVYQQGDLLPSERELMEELHVGRITVREGLRILSESGVIRTVKGKGSFVQMDSRQLQGSGEPGDFRHRFLESTQLRLLLEPAVTREVALRRTQEELEDIEANLDNPKIPESFHRAILRTAHNDLLMELFDRMSELESAPANSVLVAPAKQERFFSAVKKQHARILEAIREGDGDTAALLMRQHLEYVRDIHEEYFQMFYS